MEQKGGPKPGISGHGPLLPNRRLKILEDLRTTFFLIVV